MREVTPYNMTDLFHRQLGASLGIPAKYYDKMREDYPELLAQNVNGWFGVSRQSTPSALWTALPVLFSVTATAALTIMKLPRRPCR